MGKFETGGTNGRPNGIDKFMSNTASSFDNHEGGSGSGDAMNFFDENTTNNQTVGVQKQIHKQPIQKHQNVTTTARQPSSQHQQQQNQVKKKIIINEKNVSKIAQKARQEAQEHPDLMLKKKEYKSRRPGWKWQEDYTLLQIGYPIKIPDTFRSTKRFQLSLKYISPEDGKKHNATIRFGKKKDKEFIDHRDPVRRAVGIARLQNCDNPLQPNFWRIILLNTSETMSQAYQNFIENAGLAVS